MLNKIANFLKIIILSAKFILFMKRLYILLKQTFSHFVHNSTIYRIVLFKEELIHRNAIKKLNKNSCLAITYHTDDPLIASLPSTNTPSTSITTAKLFFICKYLMNK